MFRSLLSFSLRRLGRRHSASARRVFQPGVERLEDRLTPTTFTVTTIGDVVNDTDGKLSLREAISKANAHDNNLNLGGAADVIVLPAGVFNMALTGTDDANAVGDFDVSDSVTIRGAGASMTAVDAHRLDRVFDVFGTGISSIKVTFQKLTIRNGKLDSGRPGAGVLVQDADLEFRDCLVTGNQAP